MMKIPRISSLAPSNGGVVRCCAARRIMMATTTTTTKCRASYRLGHVTMVKTRDPSKSLAPLTINARHASSLSSIDRSSSSSEKLLSSSNSSRTKLTSGADYHRQQQPDRSFASASSAQDDDFTSDNDDEVEGLAALFNPTEEHAMLRQTLRTFVEREVEPQAHEYNKSEKFNVDLFRKLGSGNDGLGILGLTAPSEYGGCDMDATAVAIVHEELAYADPAFCLSYLAHTLLLVNNLSVNATSDEQKERFLPQICSGAAIGGMCMSEPNAGTDVLGMKTMAKYDDATDSWILNGTKMWITNGTINGDDTGDLFLVYARTGPNKFDVTQFVVEKDMPGFSLGQKITDKLGMRASMTAELVFDNVAVPSSNVVGNVNGAVSCMMRNLEIERIGLAAMALGIGRRCLNEMKAYACQRKAFDSRDLYDFGQIQRFTAESFVNYTAGRCYLYAFANTLTSLRSSGNNTLHADGTKLYCAPMAKKIADTAIQVMGGYGYVAEYNVERFWRDAKLLEIGGGTNESHHKNIARELRKMNDEPIL